MKRPLLAAMLYAALLLGANPLAAAGMDADTRQIISDMRLDDMRKLFIAPAPRKMPDIAYETPEGEKFTLADTNGHFRLVNFWATWCAPCREEMPQLDALQAEMGGGGFQVMTIATGRNRLADINRFYSQAGVTNLPILLDAQGLLGRAAGAFGLPTTILLDRDGMEIARLTGGASWNSDNAKAVLKALMAASDAAR